MERRARNDAVEEGLYSLVDCEAFRGVLVICPRRNGRPLLVREAVRATMAAKRGAAFDSLSKSLVGVDLAGLMRTMFRSANVVTHCFASFLIPYLARVAYMERAVRSLLGGGGRARVGVVGPTASSRV